MWLCRDNPPAGGPRAITCPEVTTGHARGTPCRNPVPTELQSCRGVCGSASASPTAPSVNKHRTRSPLPCVGRPYGERDGEGGVHPEKPEERAAATQPGPLSSKAWDSHTADTRQDNSYTKVEITHRNRSSPTAGPLWWDAASSSGRDGAKISCATLEKEN